MTDAQLLNWVIWPGAVAVLCGVGGVLLARWIARGGNRKIW